MNKTYLFAIVAALVAAPLALAHDPAGTPKNYCEVGSAEWSVHDYGPVASGSLIYGNEDGNLGGDCSGNTSVEPGVLCVGADLSALNPGDPATAVDVLNSIFLGFCGSEIDPPVADWDEHNEFAFGGAWMLVNDDLTQVCFGAEGHHPEFGPYSVFDNVLMDGATFTVASDTVALVPGDCGDFESDDSSDCVGSCTVTFPSGLDGAYVVYVQGTAGHAFSS
jgi:hypothetical protein